MRVVTYNVNSLSTRLTRVLAVLEEHRPDVMCLQETKTSTDGFPHLAFAAAGYEAVDHSAGRWAGVAILARTDLKIGDVARGLPGEPAPAEARWVEATVGDGLRVASVYVPNGRRVGHEQFKAKLDFFAAMSAHTAAWADRRAVIAGDFNVCPTDADVYDVDALHGGTHATPQERAAYRKILDGGFVDAYRTVEPDEPGFTWWDYRAGHFHKGFGLRIDLVLLSRPLGRAVTAAGPDRDFRKPTRVPGTKPSDHTILRVDLATDVAPTSA